MKKKQTAKKFCGDVPNEISPKSCVKLREDPLSQPQWCHFVTAQKAPIVCVNTFAAKKEVSKKWKINIPNLFLSNTLKSELNHSTKVFEVCSVKQKKKAQQQTIWSQCRRIVRVCAVKINTTHHHHDHVDQQFAARLTTSGGE